MKLRRRHYLKSQKAGKARKKSRIGGFEFKTATNRLRKLTSVFGGNRMRQSGLAFDLKSEEQDKVACRPSRPVNAEDDSHQPTRYVAAPACQSRSSRTYMFSSVLDVESLITYTEAVSTQRALPIHRLHHQEGSKTLAVLSEGLTWVDLEAF